MDRESDLTGVWLKIERAEHHMAGLISTWERVHEGYRRATIRGESAREGEQRWYLRGAPELPKDLPLVIGDVVQNLRSALDHLAWQLVVASGHSPQRKTQFPICDERPRSGSPPSIKPRVCERFASLVEESQPYNDVPDDPAKAGLSRLREMSNIDKHRVIIPVVGVLDAVTHVQSAHVTAQFIRNAVPLSDGCVVGDFVIDGAAADVELEPEFTFCLRTKPDHQVSTIHGDPIYLVISSALASVKEIADRAEHLIA